jgi:hypothetical protein
MSPPGTQVSDLAAFRGRRYDTRKVMAGVRLKF